MTGTTFIRRAAATITLALIAAACSPTFFFGSTLEVAAVGSNDMRIVWNTAYDADFDDPGHTIDTYEIRVNGALVAVINWDISACRLGGLASSTTYTVDVTAKSSSGEDSASLIPALGTLSETFTTPSGSDPGSTISCATETDTDGDRLPDWVETNTGTFVDKTNTGTDPNDPDSDGDGDGLDDGDEVTGTVDGLVLAVLGADPNRKTIFMEIDWMDDSQDCGSHSHRPSTAAIDRFIASFANAPVSNPDGSTGIDMIVDYGQGGLFNQGTLIPDVIAPIGSVNGGEFAGIKAAYFHPVREGYFHYSVHMHRYNTTSGSSGQAELYGDDLIVSLQCFDGLTNTSNTLMHELGHNIGLFHGGNVLTNYKPNYNSVMNYRFQFPGVDRDAGANSCDALGDQVLDYSSGTRIPLNENAIVEADGVCGSTAIDFNGNSVIDAAPYARDLNIDGGFSTLFDSNDWGLLAYGAVDDADGAWLRGPQIIDEQPIPAEFQN